VRRLTWRLGTVSFLLYIVAYLDRINVGLRRSRCSSNWVPRMRSMAGCGMFFAGISAFRCPVILVLHGWGPAVDASLMMVWGVIFVAMVLVSGRAVFMLCDFYWGRTGGILSGVIFYLKTWFGAGTGSNGGAMHDRSSVVGRGGWSGFRALLSYT